MTTRADLNRPFSSCELKFVKAVRFTVFDADTILGYSVAEVTDTNVYINGVPIHGGVNDPRLGPIDYRADCETCGGDIKECPGHWGHLTLARPMFHYGFLKATHNVLRSVCYYCSRLLADKHECKMQNAKKLHDNKKRLQAVMICCRAKKRCAAVTDPEGDPDLVGDSMQVDGQEEDKFRGGCGYLQPRYWIDTTVLYVAFPETEDDTGKGQDRKRIMSAQEALDIFTRIRTKDVEFMGFNPLENHPKNLILTRMAIPPPHVRPTISFGITRSEDDVTAKLQEIIKVNMVLKKLVESGAGEDNILEMAKLLQYHIFTLSDNCIIGIPQATTKSKRPLKSIRERLKSKEGRLRGTLMGKRVDYCARSVIGGDPNLNTEQVGVPRSVALNLTFPERVTPHNKELLTKWVQNGPVKWPGARFVVTDQAKRMDLRFVPDLSKINLQYGWVVERHMLDGDYIIFNRQPSLHKMSMMGHRVKVMPYSTLRFNLAVTAPYNADFDGDEMNLHLAQSHETRAEIKHMMLNPKMLVSPQGNKPVMGVVQDSLLATAKYTKRDTFLEKDLAMNIMMWLPAWDGYMPPPAIMRPKELWTGKQIFSMLLPKTLDLKRDAAIASKNKKDDPDFALSDCKVLIQDGELLAGIVCKKTIGASSGSLLHLVWLDNGPEICRNVLSFLQKMVNQWLTHNGFSCGVADIIANDETLLKVEQTLKKAKEEVREILADAQRGKLETQPGKTMYQSFESKVNQRLNRAREDAGNIGSSSLDERNNIISMVNAGSKGSPINVAQIIACVGQQNVEGSRIRYGFNERTLPHFTKDDYGAESRGFVENSYLAGLTPQEVWMHAMGGREGVIDTACKTSETGYIQRRLVKSMETLKVAYDGSARNACEDIIQFLYGEDGMDGLYIEDQHIDIMGYSNKTLRSTFYHDYFDENYGVAPFEWLAPDVLNIIKESSEAQAVLDAEWEKLNHFKEVICKEVFSDGDSKQHVPINCARMIHRARMRSRLEDPQAVPEQYAPWEIVQKTEDLLAQLEVTRAIAEGDTIGREVEDNAKIILNAHLRSHLASKKILLKDRLTKQSFDWLLGEIKLRFMKSCAPPGETIGVLAAQSVGEPATQMTLNTFHFAGVGAKNVTLGVPRLKEIINVAKVVKTPSLAVFLSGDLGKDQERAKDVQSKLEHTNLEKVTSFTQIFWDPDPTQTRVREDKEWVSEYYELPDEDDNPERLGPWLLRIQLSTKVMTDKKLTVREVGERIQKEFMGDIDCIFTDDNAEDLVLRVRLLKEKEDIGQPPGPYDPMDEKEDKDFRFLRNIEANILKDISLAGIMGIKKVFMREENAIKTYNVAAGEFKSHAEWVLDTDGVNMEEVMLLPEVDFPRLQSNDIVETLRVLGIEATRKALLFHIRMVISFDGSYVNYRHLGTMCDVMTHRGHLMAITRHGINRTNMGPWMKCSFEETVEILMDASIYNEVDHMRAVSENIIFGQLCPIGTGAFDVHMDTQALMDATPLVPESLQKEGNLFSTDSPIPEEEEYLEGGITPFPGDGDDYDIAPGTDFELENLKRFDNIEVTPDVDNAELGAKSPFSPAFGAPPKRRRVGSVAGSPYSGSRSSHMTSFHTTSPGSVAGDDGVSPMYSPAGPAESHISSPLAASSLSGAAASWASSRHSSRSGASSSIGAHTTTEGPAYDGGSKRRRTFDGSTSPAWKRGHTASIDFTTTSPYGSSPAFTPNTPGFESPFYATSTPMGDATSPGLYLAGLPLTAKDDDDEDDLELEQDIDDSQYLRPEDEEELAELESPTYTPHGQPSASGGVGFSNAPEGSVPTSYQPSEIFEDEDDEDLL